MKQTGKLALIVFIYALLFTSGKQIQQPYVSYVYNNKISTLSLYWKDDANKVIGSLGNLKAFVEGKNKKLLFAMNGGMYKTDQSALGLFEQNGKVINKLNTVTDAHGNFYMQPNGVFYITNDDKAVICPTPDYAKAFNVKHATQSGPMLLVNGKINDKFSPTSKNLNIRNGVGILPNGNAIFAISTQPVSLYGLAYYFKQMGCKNALYLDGYVSRTYAPEKGITQTDGNFGVIIGITGK